MSVGPSALEVRILVLAPTGSDAATAARILQQHGVATQICADLWQLCEAATLGVGAMLVAEEALVNVALPRLQRLLDDQPSWSDIPLIMITSGDDATQTSLRTFSTLAPAGNLTLLERPFRIVTLVSACQVALRARRRQYQVRELLDQHRRDQAQLQAHADELEQRVEERTAKLAETISELEAFSYSVSHDLRAPLRTMQGYSYFLLEDASAVLNDECRGYLNRIAVAAARLDALVQDILTYSRVTRADIRVDAVDVGRLLNEIIAQYPEFQSPHAAIVVPASLPRVRGHEGSLTQCCSNLLSNAIKFVPPGVTPRVVVRAEPRGEQVRLWFEDNGIGIDESFRDKILNMFEKAHGRDRYEGTRIGLAIVRKAAERMGGEVGVESAPGAGSRFWIQLPQG